MDRDRGYSYLLKDLGTKWRENRGDLYRNHYDLSMSREENIEKPPDGVSKEQWASFIDYCERDSTKAMCLINKNSRGKLRYNHTGGSKKLSQKKKEVEKATGQKVSRGDLFLLTHTKADGSHANRATKEICEMIAAFEASGKVPKRPAPNDSVGLAFGKEHSGRTRCLGAGALPSRVFSTSSNTSGSFTSHSTASISQPASEEVCRELQQSREKNRKYEAWFVKLFEQTNLPLPPDLEAMLADSSTGEPSSESSIQGGA